MARTATAPAPAEGRAQQQPKGRKAKADARRREQLAKMRARSGHRYLIHYDTDGPRIRLGVLWFLGAVVALAGGVWGATLYFGVAFAAAASHALRTWRARGAAVDPRLALAATAVVVLAAAFGPRAMGAALLLATIGLLVLAAAEVGEGGGLTASLARASLVLQTVLPTAVAGGCLVLLADLEIWAAVSLVLIASAYETGDYVVGSGAANAVEGPIAGAAAVLVTTLVVAALGFPPFDVGEAFTFGVAVAPLAVAGQYLASAVLPHSRAFAPAMRRVDSLLLAAPLWYAGVDVLVA